jgi:hypothetical protein
MAGTDDWSTNANLNTTIAGISIAEGNTPPGNINDAIRSVMALAKTKFNALDTALSSINVSLDPTLLAIANLGTAADALPYFTGVDTAAITRLSPFGRTLINADDAASVAALIGVVRVVGVALSDPGYIRFQHAAGFFQVAWGSASFSANGNTSVSYAAAFPNASFAVVNGPRLNTGAQDNDPGVTSCSPTGFTAFSASDVPTSGYYIACGY